MRMIKKRPLWQVTNVFFFFLMFLAGCGGGGSDGSDSSSQTFTPPDSITSDSSSQTFTPPDSITIVPDASASASKTIGDMGGVISTNGSDSTVYTLTVPPGALVNLEEATIKITPVTSVSGLPTSGGNVATVQFEPDGLVFAVPASLTITLPEIYDEKDLLAYTYEGSGEKLAFIPIESYDPSSSEVTLAIHHFSGAGIKMGSSNDLVAHPTDPSSEAYYRQQIAIIENDAKKAGKYAYFSPEYVAQISDVYLSWFDWTLSGGVQDINDYDLAWTQELAKKYSTWLADIMETQCKINGGCEPDVNQIPACFEQSGLSPLLDDIRLYAAEKFTQRYQAGLNQAHEQCSNAPTSCEKKEALDDGLAWKELTQLGGISYAPCDLSGSGIYGVYIPDNYCQGAAKEFASEISFDLNFNQQLYLGGEVIYGLRAFDMLGEEIAYTVNGDNEAFKKVWGNLSASWSLRDEKALSFVDQMLAVEEVIPYIPENGTKYAVVTSFATGTATLVAEVSGDAVCSEPLTATLEIVSLGDSTGPQRVGGDMNNLFVNVDLATSVSGWVELVDNYYYDRYVNNLGFQLRNGVGVSHVEFYIYDEKKDGPGKLIAASSCTEIPNSINVRCEFVYDVPAGYNMTCPPTKDQYFGPLNYREGYVAIAYDRRGNTSDIGVGGFVIYNRFCYYP